MTFRAIYQGEPVLNGETKRPASWQTLQAAQEWVEYWSRLWEQTGARPEIIEYREET